VSIGSDLISSLRSVIKLVRCVHNLSLVFNVTLYVILIYIFFEKVQRRMRALVAQWLEHWSYEPGVTGSNPVLSRKLFLLPERAYAKLIFLFLTQDNPETFLLITLAPLLEVL
jgi:hypothetical protein